MSGFRVRRERRAEISNKSLTFLFLRRQAGHFEVEEQAREMERERKRDARGAQGKKEKKQGSGAEDERGGAKFRPWRGRRERERRRRRSRTAWDGSPILELPQWRRYLTHNGDGGGGNSASVR